LKNKIQVLFVLNAFPLPRWRSKRFIAIEEALWSLKSMDLKEVNLTKDDLLYYMEKLSIEFKQFASSQR